MLVTSSAFSTELLTVGRESTYNHNKTNYDGDNGSFVDVRK